MRFNVTARCSFDAYQQNRGAKPIQSTSRTAADAPTPSTPPKTRRPMKTRRTGLQYTNRNVRGGREEGWREGVHAAARHMSLLAHVVPRRDERVALAEARLRDLGEVRSSVQHGPEAAVDVVPRHGLTVTGPLDRRRDAARHASAGAGLRRAVVRVRRRGFCGEARSQASSSTTAVSVISLGLIRTCARALAEQRQAYKQEFLLLLIWHEFVARWRSIRSITRKRMAKRR